MRTGAAAVTLLAGGAVAFAQPREARPVPDLPGLHTLKADFHLHTVFSDGEVWPTVHVQEAWRDGLDVIALTDHVEYQPHAADVSTDLRRPYELARPLAEQLGIVLVQGVEITRPPPGTTSAMPVGSGHFNALFVRDPAALATADLLEALRRARHQGAFVFWNHPGFMGTLEPRWHEHVDVAWREGLFQGMELVNGEDFYPAAWPWIEEKKLTILANSDYHRPTPPRGSGPPRPITLVFARAADAEGVREALLSRRTAAWLGDDLWGAEEHLRGLWNGAVSVSPARLDARPGEARVLRLRNASALRFSLRALDTPTWLRVDPATAEPVATSLLRLRVAREAPVAAHEVTLALEVSNLNPAPGRKLVVSLPVSLTVRER
ncbi:MAG TPA: histidinol-phosphatase [Vicinamibacteria bacterium]|nr:histidinol-phosphatase [Vicinamibacteria bacterium]